MFKKTNTNWKAVEDIIAKYKDHEAHNRVPKSVTIDSIEQQAILLLGVFETLNANISADPASPPAFSGTAVCPQRAAAMTVVKVLLVASRKRKPVGYTPQSLGY